MNRALLQQALDAMTTCSSYVCGEGDDDSIERYEAAIQALRTELAKPDPEPVAWIYQYDEGDFYEEASIDKEKCERWCVGFEGKAVPLFTKEQL